MLVVVLLGILVASFGSAAAQNNPVPTLSSILPNTAAVGSGAFTLTATGTNFVASSVVRWNGSNRTTTFVNSTKLQAQILASDIAATGSSSVTVFNPTPGGGTSAAKTFSITSTNPAPTLSSISPTSVTAGGAAFTLTATSNSSNFAITSVVRWNGSSRTTTFVSHGQLQAQITAADIATAGTASVTVFTPTPGGGTSAAKTFTINNPAPTATSISPSTAAVGSGAFTLTVTGTNYLASSVVRWKGSDRTTTFVSTTQLQAQILASDITATGTAAVTVFNPTPGGGTSSSVTFTITATNPVPTLSSIAPSNALAGGATFTLTTTGTNVAITSVVRWNGTSRTTTYVSSTQLQAQITAADIATAGTASVTVFSPTPGGGPSGASTFTINNPVPTLSSISPPSALAGSAAFTLTATGTNFNSSSVVRWNGAIRTTTFLSSTQLQAQILANDIATAGTAPVTVFNPTPGGGPSGAQTFTINNNPAPTLSSISPPSAAAGGVGFTLKATGTNFIASSVVRWNGSDRSTTFVSGTQLQVQILASDIATPGTAPVTVFNPTPGGGASSAQTFTINNPVPTLSSLSPSSAAAGGAAFTLTATGTNFISSSVVRWNGADRTTTYVSSTRLDAQITAADIATAGSASVTAVTPTPGGGTSSSVTFSINSPAPTLSWISPSSTMVGGAAFTLTVSGTNFISSSVVRWNGSDRTTTFVSGTQLQAQIAAADIATQGTVPVTVFTPTPGGGTSSADTFTVSGPPVAGAVTYVYDRLGRLGAVIDHDGNAAIYAYDAVGNLLSIARQGPSAVSIIDFSAGPGTVGSQVTIYGVGFSATPGNNTVTFNGTPAVVTASTPTQITTTVPAGATTGTLVVTTSGGSGTSTIPFTVLAASDAPTITGFTPTIALAGTTVAITGTNFVTSPTTNNRLRFNRTLALLGTVTSTSIGTTVPYGATSGRLSIATPAASAASADDFFVPPEGFGVADVASTGRVTVGGSGVTVSIPSYKAALLVFDGTAGQQVTLGYSNISVSLLGSDMTVYRPEGGILSSQPVGFFGGDTHIASLPVTGTYQLLIKPQGSYSGNITVTLSQDLSVGPLVVGGSSVTANITRPGQRARTTFSGTAGQWLSLYSNSTSYPPWMQLALTVTKPDGSTFFNGSVTASDGTVNWGPLPVTGTYTIVVDPEYANTPSFNLLLSEAISATMSVGGSSLPVTIPRAGQYARISFDGTAGQRISIGLTSFTLNTADFSILKPDGSTFYVQSGIWGTGTIGAVDVPSLPTTGTYVIQVDPSSNYTGAVTLLLSEEVSGSIVPGGSAVTVSITRGGQRARLTFSGSAGQRVSLKATGVTIDQSLVSIVRPDGSTQPVMTAYSNTVGFVDPTTLASSGTYALLIDPNATNTGDITLTLYDVPANPTGSVTVNGSAFTVSLPVPGQNGDVSVSGTSGEGITIRGANSTIGCMNIGLFEAGGGATSWHVCTTGFTLGWTLTSTGTHVIRVDPDTWNTGSVDVSVTDP